MCEKLKESESMLCNIHKHGLAAGFKFETKWISRICEIFHLLCSLGTKSLLVLLYFHFWKRLAVLNASRNFGLTSRRTNSKIPLTSNFSPPTKRWLRFSVPIATVPSAWPSFSPLTCHKKWPPGILNIWNRQNKNPAPRGTRENKEENNIIILHSNDSFIPLTYLTYTLCTTKFSALISTKLSAFISEIMYLLYICR